MRAATMLIHGTMDKTRGQIIWHCQGERYQVGFRAH